MKILIWVLCILSSSLIITLLRYNGMRPPTILLATLAFILATWLCKKWEQKHPTKKFDDEIDPYDDV